MNGFLQCDIYDTMEYYLAIKKNEILFVAKWMQLENIVLSEKDKYCMFSHLCSVEMTLDIYI